MTSPWRCAWAPIAARLRPAVSHGAPWREAAAWCGRVHRDDRLHAATAHRLAHEGRAGRDPREMDVPRQLRGRGDHHGMAGAGAADGHRGTHDRRAAAALRGRGDRPHGALVPGTIALTRTTFFADEAAGGMRSATWGTITTGTALVTRAAFLAGPAFLTRTTFLASPMLSLEMTVFPVGALRP